MKIVFHVNVISPHVVPNVLATADLFGKDQVRYVYCSTPSDPVRSQDAGSQISSIAIDARRDKELARHIVLDADLLIEGTRDYEIMESRLKRGKATIYASERWFKPVRIDAIRHSEYAKGAGIYISGFLKMLLPFAYSRGRKMFRLMHEYDNFLYLPDGIHAASDMARMLGFLGGDIKFLFRRPKLRFEPRPGGKVWIDNGIVEDRCCLDRMRMWGYFVEGSKCLPGETKTDERAIQPVRVLWVGRLLSWKRVDTIIKAVRELADLRQSDETVPLVTLDIYGAGPEEKQLKKLANGYEHVISFLGYLPISEVREVMRRHDVYVLASNEFEGWGAVVNEALEEGMRVIGTHEAGASATMLPGSNLFHSGDWRMLKKLLVNGVPETKIGPWTADNAAAVIQGLFNEMVVKSNESVA